MPLPVTTALFAAAGIDVAAWQTPAGRIIASAFAGLALLNEGLRWLAMRPTPEPLALPPRARERTPMVGGG